MHKFPKSRVEIERLVLHELQAADNCEGAAGISVVACLMASGDANWTVTAYNAGSASGYECDLALQSIVRRLQGFYDLVQKH
jgi:hypothetical protein